MKRLNFISHLETKCCRIVKSNTRIMLLQFANAVQVYAERKNSLSNNLQSDV